MAGNDDRFVYVGKKPLMAYVLAAVMQINTESREVIIKARGQAISRAVDVAEILRNKFVRNAKVRDIRISTETLARKDEVIGGFGEAFYRRCIGFLEKPGISVVRDAAKARSSARVTGMHDPTEGGILTGAYEMARGSGMGLTLFLDRIPVYEETSLLCGRFGISPYGSIASGSLLIAVSKGEGKALERAFDGMPPLNAVSRGAGGRSHGGGTGSAGSYTVEPLSYLNLVGEFTRKGGAVRLADGEEIKPSGIDEITKLL